MRSYVTSFNGLFSQHAPDVPAVRRIEIPIFQRDYAQGRDSDAVGRIRAGFLDALHQAVTSTANTVSLDFIYGDVIDGTLRPLDGQQRLTTLFLLHWYLAWRSDRLDLDLGWKHFEYATRAGARRFCACLTESKPPIEGGLRAWFEDQHWFLHTWRHDPTISSMMVMIEAIHEKFAGADYLSAWTRLVDAEVPSVSFHLLPIEEMGLSDDLYIKMNSRGKPLTPFENFKARFEQVLEQSAPGNVDTFARKVDGTWANLLWPFRGRENIVDDEFLRYFRFISELCAWSSDIVPSEDLDTLAECVFGPGNDMALMHLAFLERCFDTWLEADIDAIFSDLFALEATHANASRAGKVVLFGNAGSSVNLFAECCQGGVRLGWPRTLLLYAVLLHRLHDTVDFPRRLRVLRNLIEASNNELRAERMPALLLDVQRIVVDGGLDRVESFNQAQVSDEKSKASLLDTTPTLAHTMFQLEDHPLLRGCLDAFEHDPAIFARRADSFNALFATPDVLPVLTGALLAAGDYGLRKLRFMQLGSVSDYLPWRQDILTGANRTRLAGVRAALGRILDVLADRDGDIITSLVSFTSQWLKAQPEEDGLDWRWYLVRYPAMRAGRSGIYAYAHATVGYRLCMLDKQAMSSYYRDPFLTAVRDESRIPEYAVTGSVGKEWPHGPWFTGYETEARWMHLAASGLEIQCADEGFLIRANSLSPSQEVAFTRICSDHNIGPGLLLSISKVTRDGTERDSRDRVQLGTALLRDLVAAGL